MYYILSGILGIETRGKNAERPILESEYSCVSSSLHREVHYTFTTYTDGWLPSDNLQLSYVDHVSVPSLLRSDNQKTAVFARLIVIIRHRSENKNYSGF